MDSGNVYEPPTSDPPARRWWSRWALAGALVTLGAVGWLASGIGFGIGVDGAPTEANETLSGLLMGGGVGTMCVSLTCAAIVIAWPRRP